MQRATCYGRLGLGAEAGALWSRVLSTVRRPAAGTAGGMARQATAAAAAREPDQAVEIARAVATIAVKTCSARVRREQDAGNWSSSRSVRCGRGRMLRPAGILPGVRSA